MDIIFQPLRNPGDTPGESKSSDEAQQDYERTPKQNKPSLPPDRDTRRGMFVLEKGPQSYPPHAERKIDLFSKPQSFMDRNSRRHWSLREEN